MNRIELIKKIFIVTKEIHDMKDGLEAVFGFIELDIFTEKTDSLNNIIWELLDTNNPEQDDIYWVQVLEYYHDEITLDELMDFLKAQGWISKIRRIKKGAK